MPVLESVLGAAGDESQDDIILTVSTSTKISDILIFSRSNVTLEWPTPLGRETIEYLNVENADPLEADR